MSDTTVTKKNELVTFLRQRDYILMRELGEGACGKTVLLRDEQIDEFFVCKKFSPCSDSLKNELFTNFIREIKLLHQIHHSNVVRVFNYYLYPTQHVGYILMEFVNGSEVAEFVANAPNRINEIFLQTVSGFEYLENAKILHRDIRPANIMVTDDGTVKIIDLGFGKQVAGSKDFDKSISLNWWCDTPNDFVAERYDFTTEVYFVGKLFEKLILDHQIEAFHFTEVLRRMCVKDPLNRLQSFSAVLRELRNERFDETDFSGVQLQAYRQFADATCKHITKIHNGISYIDDLRKITRDFVDKYRTFMLEEFLPDCSVVIGLFLEGSYYYKKSGMPVSVVKEFLDLLRSSSPERGEILLANLHTRLDSIPRYTSDDFYDDVPF